MSAAYLQALHADENEPVQSSSSSISKQTNGQVSASVDLSNQDAFPSLADPDVGKGKGKANQAARATSNGWGAGSLAVHASSSPVPSPVASSPLAAKTSSRDSLVLPTSSIQLASPLQRKRGDITTVGEAAAIVMKSHPQVKIDASTSKATTTFILLGPDDQVVARAKLDLVNKIAKKITISIEIPANVRAYVIGAKGRTLKTISDQTGTQINLPPKDSQNIDEDDANAMAEVTIIGHSHGCEAAKERIQAIVAERQAKIVHTAVIEPAKFEAVFWPFIEREHKQEWQQDNIKISHDPKSGLTVSGEKDKVAHWHQHVQTVHDDLKTSTRTTSIVIEKRQHRFLRGHNAHLVLQQTGWSVELPPQDSPEEHVILRGPSKDKDGRSKAMSLVMEQAESAEVDSISIANIHPGASAETYIPDLCRYLSRRNVLQKAVSGQSQVHLPSPQDLAKGQPDIEIVATDPQNLSEAKESVLRVLKSIPPANLRCIYIDPLLQKYIIPAANTKQSKAVKALADQYAGTDIVFPSETAGSVPTSDAVLLCWLEPSEPRLADLAQDIQKIVADLGNIKSETISLPQKHHEALKGPNGTTLNAIIGEDKNVAIVFGSSDQVQIRGSKEEIARVKLELQALAERAETEGVETMYETSFDLDARFVGYIVGKSGSNLNKLHQELGVNVQIDEAVQQAAEGSKPARKSSRATAHVVIRGRRETVEEAKKRIIAHAERIADEATLTIALPPSVDKRSLIGKQGVFAQRLEAKYEVRVNFPKATEEGEGEIVVRGPRKGAEAARRELEDLIAYEREMSNSVTFKIPMRAVSRIVGKQGSQVNQISSETGANIEVDSSDEHAAHATVILKGSAEAINAAKKQIQAVAKDTEDEVIIQVTVAKELQPALIGKGGQNIRDMMLRAGGPSDARTQGYMMRFPRPNDEPSDIVTLRGKAAIVHKIRDDILTQIAQVGNRTVLGVAVPRSHHAAIIGRGGSTVNDLSAKHNVKITFPSSRDAAVGEEIENAEDLADSASEDIVRVSGSRDACVAAIADIKAKTVNGSRSSSAASSVLNTPTPKHVKTVLVPARFHSVISDKGRFFRRSVPPRITIDHGSAKLPNTKESPLKPFANGVNGPTRHARIDEDEEAQEDSPVLQWEVVPIVDEADDSPDIPWNISGQNEDLVDQTERTVQRALAKAQQNTHMAYCRIQRSNMPKIIGRGGSGLEAIRTNALVEVEVLGRQDADTLSFVGSLSGVDAAREEIIRMLSPR